MLFEPPERHTAPDAPPPNEALQQLIRLVNLITEVREEQVSAQMGFGRTDEEKQNRARYYAATIQRLAGRVDDELEKAIDLIHRLTSGGT